MTFWPGKCLFRSGTVEASEDAMFSIFADEEEGANLGFGLAGYLNPDVASPSAKSLDALRHTSFPHSGIAALFEGLMAIYAGAASLCRRYFSIVDDSLMPSSVLKRTTVACFDDSWDINE